ncbi:catalase-like domain-containing protein [Pseudomassariella vexata]|uniref:Catalase n=1 Tax=Pseudomassariella vexata TaxID=1141098 RepID=A0A1Y2EAB0_9PEZI|nr:catalase-like domain-containing protein [Pseudomassariella vexata]ORY68472.1 catalase-like domain-containing protein [Pseudomassariella vexata]
MASNIIPSTVKNIMSGEKGAKATQLQPDIQEPGKDDRITTDYGVRQSNTDDTLKIVNDQSTGPQLLEDSFAREKIHRFDHERIPERVVHARGAGAFGTFKLLESAADVTCAAVLNDTTRETPVFVRFSTVQGSRGSADTVRDVRGFAVKFYTQEGNWDIVGNNIPVFFIQDSIKFPDFVHAVKPEPHNEVPQAQSAHNNFWDFVNLHTEATHMYMWAMSDRAIPRSYRMMQGFGVNTFVLINAKGERHFCKFHWTPELGVHSFVWDEALKLAGQDPDFHRKDLNEAIENGAYPKWTLGIQVIPEGQEHDFDFDILDATKIWPEDLIPVRNIGEMELNKVVDEYFPQTEQVAFCTAHMVPGIAHSNDPLLQGRSFSYFDTQLSRLGINWQELPINRPVCPVMNFNRDGQGRHRITKGPINYYPNRHGIQPPATANEGAYLDYPEKVAGIKARAKSPKFKEHFNQAQLFLNSLSPPERAHITSAFGFELDHCDDPIVYERMSLRLADIDLELAQSVAAMVGGPVPDKASRPNHGKKAPKLSQTEFAPTKPTIATRRIAIIIADGYDSVTYNGVKAAITASGALPFTIAPRRHEIFPAGSDNNPGSGVRADHHLEGMRSTMFDAIFVPGGSKSIETLSKNGRALHWMREAFGHLKPIGGTGEAVELFKLAFALPGISISQDTSAVESYGVVTQNKVDSSGFSEMVQIAKEGANFLEKFWFQISQHRCWARELDGLSSQVAY